MRTARTAMAIGLAAAAMAGAQGTTPKPSAAEYPVHGEARGIAIGAEFMVHSFGTGEQMFVVEDYLVVEVALFPPKGETMAADPGRFALRVNGRKTPLTPQPPAMVAAWLRSRQWQRMPFPGAPQQQQQPRLPAPPRAPDTGPPGGVERKEPANPAEVLTQTALPTDPHRGPIAGFLYFPFTAKTSSIKSLDLEWEGAVVKLR